jgi:hypothetical protein
LINTEQPVLPHVAKRNEVNVSKSRVNREVLGGFGSRGRAQSETDPDHFDSPNTEPFKKARPNVGTEAVTISYEGRFSLPYKVQCNGKGLAPGKYSVSLLSDGKVGQAILNPNGQAIPILGVVRRPTNKHQTDAILVEVDGGTKEAVSHAYSRIRFDS